MAKKEWTPEEIKALREAAELDPMEFALRIGVGLATVYRWEGDRSKPRGLSVDSLNRLQQEVEAGQTKLF